MWKLEIQSTVIEERYCSQTESYILKWVGILKTCFPYPTWKTTIINFDSTSLSFMSINPLTSFQLCLPLLSEKDKPLWTMMVLINERQRSNNSFIYRSWNKKKNPAHRKKSLFKALDRAGMFQMGKFIGTPHHDYKESREKLSLQ